MEYFKERGLIHLDVIDGRAYVVQHLFSCQLYRIRNIFRLYNFIDLTRQSLTTLIVLRRTSFLHGRLLVFSGHQRRRRLRCFHKPDLLVHNIWVHEEHLVLEGLRNFSLDLYELGSQ